MITEEEINEHLQLTLRTYFSLEKRGYKELAGQVLRIGSKLAENDLLLAGVKPYKRYCPTCKKQLRNRHDFIAVDNSGECLSCDHLRGEDPEDEGTGEIILAG